DRSCVSGVAGKPGPQGGLEGEAATWLEFAQKGMKTKCKTQNVECRTGAPLIALTELRLPRAESRGQLPTAPAPANCPCQLPRPERNRGPNCPHGIPVMAMTFNGLFAPKGGLLRYLRVTYLPEPPLPRRHALAPTSFPIDRRCARTAAAA